MASQYRLGVYMGPGKSWKTGLLLSFDSLVALIFTPVTSRASQAYSAIKGVMGYGP